MIYNPERARQSLRRLAWSCRSDLGERMWRRPRTLVPAVVVAVAALAPLFGDPRVTPVTHPLWARILLRALELTEAVRTSSQASQVFAALSWRDSLSLPAERYLRADGIVVREEGGRKVVAALAVPGEVAYPIAIVQPGDYQLRARLAGPPGSEATAEIAPLAGGAALGTFILAPAASAEWVFGGSTHLDPGTYGVQLLLPSGCRLSRVEIAPPCLNPIEPAGGWAATAVTTAEDLALTALRAIDAEHELPPADLPTELTGEEFQVEAPPEALQHRAAAGFERMTLRAGQKGLRAIVSFELPEPGLYSLSALGRAGEGQRWLLDTCREAVVCPGETGGWRPILSQPFAAGRHTLLLTLGAGATVERVRIERKKSSPPDYVSTLKRLGFDPGPQGPVRQAVAFEAGRFVRDRRRAAVRSMCGDHVVVDETPPVLTARVARSPERPPDGGGNVSPLLPIPAPTPPVEAPIGPPLLPPQPPATPTHPLGG